jgi:hypothetical protein
MSQPLFQSFKAIKFQLHYTANCKRLFTWDLCPATPLPTDCLTRRGCMLRGCTRAQKHESKSLDSNHLSCFDVGDELGLKSCEQQEYKKKYNHGERKPWGRRRRRSVQRSSCQCQQPRELPVLLACHLLQHLLS